MLQACMPIKCFRGLQDHCGDYEDLAKPPAPPSPPTSIPPLTSGSVLSADSALSGTGLQDSFVTTHIIDLAGELQLEAAATAKRGYLGWFPTTPVVGMFFLIVFSVHGCWTKALREMQKLVMFLREFTVWGDVNNVRKELETIFEFLLFRSCFTTADVFINTSGSLTVD